MHISIEVVGRWPDTLSETADGDNGIIQPPDRKSSERKTSDLGLPY